MEGDTIHQWIEKLIPMLNGEYTMGYLTHGLTENYKKRVYEIAETLYKNGYVRDLSQDLPHQLNSRILEKYATQIEFIESFVDSSAYRFQKYRQAKVLAVGSGPFFVSLVSALIESGLPKFQFIVTDSIHTNLTHLHEVVEHARKKDQEISIEQIPFQKENSESFWRETMRPFEWILYTSQDGNIEELKNLNQLSKEEGKTFLPAIYLQHVGLAGPLVHPESDGCWESAWRRIHQSALQKNRHRKPFSSIAGSLLANVIVFEFFKKATGVAESNQGNQIYHLDFETLEGDWFSFITHPLLVKRHVVVKRVENLHSRLIQISDKERSSSRLLPYFSSLTSKEIGIFHTWQERNLSQLPLTQCFVQAVNPLSEGPAELLPEVACSGITHEEAQREAGLTGIEMYVSKLIDLSVTNAFNVGKNKFIGIGAGETIQEAICRGLQGYLDEELRKRKINHLNTIYPLQLGTIEDKCCKFFLDALTTMNGEPKIALGEEIVGFPVIWVKSNGHWYSSVGLNTTMAIRYALQQVLMDTQNQVNVTKKQVNQPSCVFFKEQEYRLDIPSSEEITQSVLLQSSIKVLNQNRKGLLVFDLSIEPFLKTELAGVYGVQLGEEES